MVISALFTRGVFCLHCLVAFWTIFSTSPWHPLYCLLLSGLVGLVFETVVTIHVRKGAEYKWFCPSVFFYLLSIVPCVWILELDMLQLRVQAKDELEQQGINFTSKLMKQPGNLTLFNGVTVPLVMEPAQWVVMVEQLVLFVLILGRWMLPKGDISRDELSQLLLVYIGMAADIIEFFEAFKEERVKYNWMLIVSILSIWSASLLQFTLVLTATKSVKSRAGFAPHPDENEGMCKSCCGCCGNEVFGIVTTMVLQDGPFLILRLLLLIEYDVNSYMHIFFTVKNTLVLLLMFYRLFVVFEYKSMTDKDSDHPKPDDAEDYLELSATESPAKFGNYGSNAEANQE
ncbi:hypothetical protein CAPTEDRAFT_115670 [Capitella teleta]|uniref:Transmembrane protein 26 n=1 Tax=Capitella teleta TaxID=283909 RepID=R7V195_CAPTE|nr:hypothetical protein CAPTEDRAFT_115670 [Capitella teleta]|eukprot:ELU09466.1 hypothetical protein CAPTEDRAFT_115670 [Capitella teleta]